MAASRSCDYGLMPAMDDGYAWEIHDWEHEGRVMVLITDSGDKAADKRLAARLLETIQTAARAPLEAVRGDQVSQRLGERR